MNSLKLNNKVRHNIITKTTSLALASVLITSMFVGLIPIVVMPAAAANTYLSVSQTQLGSDNAIQITVTDSSLTSAPTITLSWGASSQQALTDNFLKTPLGDWILFIANSTSSLDSTSTLDNAPSIVNSTVSNNMSSIGDDYKTLVEKVALVVSGVGEDEATITYGERSETVTLALGETDFSDETTDRTEAPPSAKVFVTMTDPTTNLDPTLRESKTYTIATKVGATSQDAPADINMTETGINTGIFEGQFNTTDISTEPTHGQTVYITITDDDDSDDTADVTVAIRASDGVLSTSGTLTYTDELTVTLTDADRNLDSKAKETLTAADPLYVVQVNATVGTGLYNVSDLTLKETAVNSGIFEGNISVSIGNVTALVLSTNNSKAVAYNVSAGDDLDLALKYTDPEVVISNHFSTASVSLSITEATIAFDKTSYLPNTNGIAAVITLTEPDANDDPDALELLTVTNASTRGLLIHSSGTTVGKLNFTETKSGEDIGNLTISDDVEFIETAKNTGIFELRIDIETELSGERTSGWTLNATYYDSFEEDYVSGTASIGGTTGTLELDRTALPTLPAVAITVKVTLTDADENTNAAAADTATVSIYPKNATNEAVKFNGSTTKVDVILTETGQDTSIFTATWTFTLASATGNVSVAPGDGRTWHLVEDSDEDVGVTGALMIGGTFNVSYSEPLATGNHVDAIGTVTPHTGVLAVSPSGVSLNGTVVFTYTDEDLNDNTAAKDTVVITVKNETTNQETSTLTLTETGVNTGIFNGSKRAGAQSPIESPSYKAGDVIKATYKDLATANSYYATAFTTATLTGTSTIASNDASIKLDATSYGPYSIVKVNITDADLILEAIGSVELDLVKTSKEECRTTELNNPKKYSDGVFEFTILLSPTSAGTCASGAGIKTALEDTITVYFVDVVDAAGTAGVVREMSATIDSLTGTVAASPANVLVGEFLTITVTDNDQNKDQNVIESVNVIVTTDTWTLGQNVTLPETVDNSGIFEAKIKIVAGIPATTNEVRGAVGDTITVSYKDRSNDTGKVSNVLTTGIVGVTLPPLERVPAGTPATVDANGVAATPAAGTVSVIQTEVCNDDTVTHTFTYIVQIKDGNGVIISINWIQGQSLDSGDCLTPGLSWTPGSAGEYTIEIFVWESLTNAVALSPVSTLTVTAV